MCVSLRLERRWVGSDYAVWEVGLGSASRVEVLARAVGKEDALGAVGLVSLDLAVGELEGFLLGEFVRRVARARACRRSSRRRGPWARRWS